MVLIKSTGHYITFPFNSKWLFAKTCGFGANCGRFAIHWKYLQRWFSGFNSIQLGLGWEFFKKRERIEIVQDKSAPAIERLISSLDFHHHQQADPIYPYLAQIFISNQLKLPRLLCTPWSWLILAADSSWHHPCHIIYLNRFFSILVSDTIQLGPVSMTM